MVPEEEDSFEYDAEEELDIPGGDDGDSEETDDAYVPEGGSGSSGESDGEGGDIQKSGWVKCLQKKGRVKFKKREWAMFLRKKGRLKFRKRGG